MNRKLRTTLTLAICFTWVSQAVGQDDIVQFNNNGQLVPPSNVKANGDKGKPRQIGKKKSTAKTTKKKASAEKTIGKSKSKVKTKPKAASKSKNKRTLKKQSPKLKTTNAKKLPAKSVLSGSSFDTKTSVTLKRLPMMPGPDEKPPQKMTKSSPRMLNKKATDKKALDKVRKELKAQRDFAKNAPKRLPPKPKAAIANKITAATKSPGTSKTKGLSKTAKVGLVATGLTAGGLGIAAVKTAANASNEYQNGNISQTQLVKSHATNATETGAALYKLKKLNPSTLLLNDVVGTDPLSLGVDAVGDLLNGTNNAEQSVKGMKDAWNQSLVKETFTDPKSAALRVGNDLKNTTDVVQNMAGGVSNGIDNGFNKLQESKFGQSKFGNAVTNGVQTVWNISPHKKLTTDAKGTLTKAGEGLNKGFNAVKTKTKEAADAAKAKVNNVKSTATAKINKAKAGVTKAKDKVTGFVGGLFKKK